MRTVANRPLLDYHLERIERVGCPVFVATTTKARDDVIEQHCDNRGLSIYRGSESDVLKRYRNTAKKYRLDSIVRVTSDCPLLDPALIREGIEIFEQHSPDFLANNHPERTFPHGMDFSIFTEGVLEQAHQKARDPRDREHVSTFIRAQSTYQKRSMEASEDLSHIRLTVDYPGDLEAIRILIKHHQAHQKSYQDIVEIYRREFF